MAQLDLPLVSVIVPVYNQALLLDKTLQSIVGQEYKNIEILISDDGSNDGTQAVLQSFKHDHRVTIFLQNQNLGITGNYNFLVAHAKGEYIAVFSGDDIMMPDKLSKQVAALNFSSAGFCHHAVIVTGLNGLGPQKLISRKYDENRTTLEDVLRNMGIPGSMSLVYRASVGEVPAFDSSIATASDWLQLIHLSAKSAGIYIDEPLCYYCQDGAYNGKDPTKYEDDFLRTIELARMRYAFPGDNIDRACNYALSRYSAGAGFRRLMRGDRAQARVQLRRSLGSLKLFPAAVILYLLTYLPLGGGFYGGLKKIYKTFFA